MESNQDFLWDEGSEDETAAAQLLPPPPAAPATDRSLPSWLQTGLIPFFWVAVVGLVLSVAAHLIALLGFPQPLGEATMLLHGGVFVVWIPAVLVSGRLAGWTRRWDYWSVVLAGCPRWARWGVYGFFAYAIFNFLWLSPALAARSASGNTLSSTDILAFSGHWMAFYSAGAGMLYSGIHIGRTERRCLNGHRVSRSTSMCEKCGAPVVDPRSDPTAAPR